ncbi:glycosyltransferase family 4 protein [Nocardiopsis suaedae]|uniref:Glycosyltransferase family 4 protein n=1 Tax=Nocardiopsis suaedae TaxID=3018444 RepID=A0ABT4TTU1_9ACTN|nr:glycosyltransferase family 4 protein [Nocardiopsis suaedae]MDA2808113.1 glycosyltransferase family 4 protein [Nocardiopsis suaedae]
MRIALVLGTSSGGVGNHVRSAARLLAGRGHRVAVLAPSEVGGLFAFDRVGARFAPVEIGAGPRPLRDAAAAARLSGLVSGADVVHAHGVRAGAMCAAAGAAPLAVTVHNAPPEVSGPRALAYPALERVVALRADAVLGVSGDLVERMRALGARRTARAVVAAPPLAPPERPRKRVRAELGVGPDRPLLLVVARLAAQKGLEVLLDAVPKAVAGGARPLVAIAGEGPLRPELERRIREGGVPVRLLGHRTDVADLLAAADAFILPSRWEGPSLVVMEALRAGLPVVATRVGGIADLYEDCALLVPPGDPGALAAAVRRVLDEPGLAGRMSARAHEAAARLPTEEDTADQLEALYGRLTR